MKLRACGLVEWQPEEALEVSLVDRETGELVEIVVSNSQKKWLVVCDDCGLPFEMKGNFAVTTRDGAAMEFENVAGPCEHCGGFGHPLVTIAARDGLVTRSNSAEFGDGVLAHLAEQVRSGKVDVSEAAARLRAQEKPHLTRLADWIEAHPTNAMVAATLIAAVASLVGPQLAPTETPNVTHHHAPSRYSEDEVAELVDTILDHYDQRQLEPPPSPKPSGSGKGKQRDQH